MNFLNGNLIPNKHDEIEDDIMNNFLEKVIWLLILKSIYNCGTDVKSLRREYISWFYSPRRNFVENSTQYQKTVLNDIQSLF